MSEIIKDYLKQISDIPNFLNKYLELDSLKELKGKGYFCGMDYASKDVYSFLDYVSRYDHSLTTALLTWRYSENKNATINALFHDYKTPCFSHVIDYMHGDYATQETTEQYGKSLLSKDKELIRLLKNDNLTIANLDEVKYSIVDNKRPKLCADRLDGIILTSLILTQTIDISEAKEILDDIRVFVNEDDEFELGFTNLGIAQRVSKLNEQIDISYHSDADNYMMNLLSDITKKTLESKIIAYDDLYNLSEEELFAKLLNCRNKEILNLIKTFQTIKLANIPPTTLPNVKKRYLNPLVLGKRLIAKNK